MKQHRILSEGGPISDNSGAVTGITYCDGMMVHFSAAPTTSEYFTVTLDSAAGAQYDTVLYKIDPSAASTTDIFWTETFALLPGDALRTTYANTDARIIGVTFRLR